MCTNAHRFPYVVLFLFFRYFMKHHNHILDVKGFIFTYKQFVYCNVDPFMPRVPGWSLTVLTNPFKPGGLPDQSRLDLSYF